MWGEGGSGLTNLGTSSRDPEDVRANSGTAGTRGPRFLLLLLSGHLLHQAVHQPDCGPVASSGWPGRQPSQRGRRGGVWLPRSLNSFINMMLACIFLKHSSLIFQLYNYFLIS